MDKSGFIEVIHSQTVFYAVQIFCLPLRRLCIYHNVYIQRSSLNANFLHFTKKPLHTLFLYMNKYSGGRGGGVKPQEATRDGILIVEASGHKLEFSRPQVFVGFSTLIFNFYKMLCMNRLEFSSFLSRIFCMHF